MQADKRRHILLLTPLGKQTERAATEALGTELEHWATAWATPRSPTCWTCSAKWANYANRPKSKPTNETGKRLWSTYWVD